MTVIATGLSAAKRMTVVHSAPQSHSQIFARTGTDNLPLMDAVAQQPQAQAPQDYSGMATPTVWRTSRAQTAAAKVEALSSNGMDEIEIPAFLRKQQLS